MALRNLRRLSLCTTQLKRCYQTSPSRPVPPELESVIVQKWGPCKAHLGELKQKYGDMEIDNVTVKTALGGMRNTRLLVCETSQVDPKAGLFYRGIPIAKLAELLPKAQATATQPPMEALLWLLLAGECPTASQIEVLRHELLSRMDLPPHAVAAINALPTTTHPMTQLVVGVAACQTESHFSSDYADGKLRKDDYWKVILEDGLTLIAKLPQIAGLIYRRSFRGLDKQKMPTINQDLDWSANVARLMGFEEMATRDVFRLYVFLHADHEGGNVSAHTAHLVGSALADPFLSFASAMCGLAGPLHGLANQENLRFLRQMAAHFKEKGKSVNEANVKDYVETEVLGRGKVVPGFGHAVLRTIDPRYLLEEKFARASIRDDELTNLLHVCADVVPKVLIATGKVSNPYPNVDAHSGVILSYFGVKEEEFYTVLFGLSRSIGIVAQLVWDRILNLPIERPKSINLETLEKLAVEHSNNHNHNKH